MGTNIELMDRVGDIVMNYPNTAEVFKQYRIDFCCGGGKSLQQVIQDKQIEQNALLASLEEASVSLMAEEMSWGERSAAELVGHIVGYHHRYLKSSLPQIGQYVNKVARVHGPHHPELFQVQDWLEELRLDMELHMEKEENEAFPAVMAYEQTKTERSRLQLLQILGELEQDHRDTGNLLQKIRIVTNDFAVPQDACTTFKLAYLKLEELEADMFQHIHLENNILFARAAYVGADASEG